MASWPPTLPSGSTFFAQTTKTSAIGRIGDPHLAALEHIAAIDGLGARGHARRVAAVVGLGQAEAADPFAGGELGQILLPLRFVAVGVDRVHDEAALHAHRTTVAAVHALDLTRDEAIADAVQSGAAVAFDRAAQEAERAHLVHDFAVELFVPRGHQHARLQLLLAVGVGGVAHGALVVAELRVEVKRVFPVELGSHGGCLSIVASRQCKERQASATDSFPRRTQHVEQHPIHHPRWRLLLVHGSGVRKRRRRHRGRVRLQQRPCHEPELRAGLRRRHRACGSGQGDASTPTASRCPTCSRSSSTSTTRRR